MNHQPESLGKVIEKMLDVFKLRAKVQEAQVVDAWGEIVGPMIEKRTRDVYIRHKKLYVKLDSPVVKQELMYMRSKIVERVNQHVGAEAITDVVLL